MRADGTIDTSHKRVVLASSLGTAFEWYDFFLYGSLAATIGKQFFGGLNDSSQFIFALLAFAAGFAVRPFGAIVFGRFGDLIGRKYTFLVTIVIMGMSTFLVGVLPSYASIGMTAPVLMLVAWKGDIYYGLWYPIVVALVTVVIGLLFVKETKDVDLVG